MAFQDIRTPNTRVPDWKSHFPGRSTKADVPAEIAHLALEKLLRQRETRPRRRQQMGAAKAAKIIHKNLFDR
jgi:hypothetical protein